MRRIKVNGLEIEVTEESFVSEVYHWLRKEGMPAVAHVKIPGVKADIFVVGWRPVIVKFSDKVDNELLAKSAADGTAIVIVNWRTGEVNYTDRWEEDGNGKKFGWKREKLENPHGLIKLIKRLAWTP